MKEDKYTKILAKNLSGLCNGSYARFSEKRFTQIYKALYADAMFVSLSGAQIIWGRLLEAWLALTDG